MNKSREATMLTHDVRSATEADQKAVTDVITLAFSSDPMARWAFSDPATYMSVMPQFVQAFGGNGFAHGTVYCVDAALAAAMWLPPGVHPDSERMMQLVERHVPPHKLPDMMQVFEQMDHYHPKEPHWYLPLIGVDPACQGRGFGSALLRFALERCDGDGLPAYLESSNPRNIPLYERHGFETVGSIQVGSSPAIVPMLRRRR